MDLRMETSQAVSMLQPFRHPKPGLTIMKRVKYKTWRKIIKTMKAEELKQKAKVEFFGHKIKYQFTESELDEYSQQVSREDGFLFWKWVHKKKSHDQRLRYSFYELFDEWKSKQKG